MGGYRRAHAGTHPGRCHGLDRGSADRAGPPRLFTPGLERAEEVVYGDMLTDPVQLDIIAITFPAPPTPEERESIYADLEKRLSDVALSDGFKLDAPMERTQSEGRVVLRYSHEMLDPIAALVAVR